MATEKLYWRDPFLTSFEDASWRIGAFGGKPSIILERSLFYPEAGGQLGDQGTLVLGAREVRVCDTQIDDEGTIHHLVVADAVPLEASEGPVRGAIDPARRRDHMQQHTAQHMLSRALADVLSAETISARLGESACTIDIDAKTLDEAALHRAEDQVNAVVMGDVVVRALFPSPEELATLPLRRTPKVATNVRVIDIEGFDMSPCGGTHCTRTGQIGVVRIAGVERYKGGHRIAFHAGRRAVADARAKESVLAELTRDFTCGASSLPAAVAKLRAELKARQDALGNARSELTKLLADSALRDCKPDADGATRVLVVRDGDDVGMLRSLAGRLVERPDVFAVCAAQDADSGDYAVVVQRGASVTIDCGKWLKDAAARFGGRGGGRPDRAEGKLPKVTPLADALPTQSKV